MTDNKIVKALECCKGDIADCHNCPYDEICGNHDNKMLIDTLNLINRQKAEIERLKRKLVAYEPSINRVLFSQMLLEQKEKAEAFEKKWKAEVKSEAYREFAELLKQQKYQSSDWSHGEHPYVVEESDIDNILNELVGEDDE